MIVTVVVCTFDRYERLPRAIESVMRQDLPADDYRITVVDNSPERARSREMSLRWARVANLRWLHEPATGLSRARNAALQATETPLVAFLDDDAVAGPSWLLRKVEAFERLGPDVHAIGGRVRLRFEGARPDWLGDGLLPYLSACDLGEETRLIRPDEALSGTNLSFRTDAVRAAGGFSPALGRAGGGAALMSNAEQDLQERMSARGGLAGYCPLAEVEHAVPPARLDPAWFRKRLAWQAVADFLRMPDAMHESGPDAWVRTRRHLAGLKPSDRTLRGLAVAPADARRLQQQLGATYDTVHAILAGLRDGDG